MKLSRHLFYSSLLAIVSTVASSGCTFHRNLLLRYHLEFDADSIPDECVPEQVAGCSTCRKTSKLGMKAVEEVPAKPAQPTPAQLGHARFHPLPTKPVFPSPDGTDMADMQPPAPEWYLREHQPEAGPRLPGKNYRLDEIEAPPAPDDSREARRLTR